jgi:hypothetical protein
MGEVDYTLKESLRIIYIFSQIKYKWNVNFNKTTMKFL